jgi:eukaryotic-like serine/threonine-protein kinase
MGSEATAGIGIGTVVAGSYEVTGLLGRGGMGAVWLARHLRLPGKRVAIKVLLGGAGGDAQALARFRREAEVASRIGHPNIVEVLDFNTLADGTPYQVLEFLDGESLGARLRRERLPVTVALELARQLGSALQAAHRAGVVHRDLKPENIVLVRTDAGGVLHDRVKILDFGISKIRGSQTLQTQEAVLIGTPQYMSPEQASGKNNTVDHRTDIFALGAIVYEMLAGKSAFAGDSLVAVVMDIVQGRPDPLAQLAPDLPPPVVAAVERALAKSPAERWQQVSEFIAALTGRPLETLDQTPGVRVVAGGAGVGAGATTAGAGAGGGSGSGAGGRPLSQEEVLGATQLPASGAGAAVNPGAATEAPPPTSVTTTAARLTPTPVTTPDDAGVAAVAAAKRKRRSPALVLAGVALAAAALAGVYVLGQRSRDPGAAGAASAGALPGTTTPVTADAAPAGAVVVAGAAAGAGDAAADDAGAMAAVAGSSSEPASARMPGKWRRHTAARAPDDSAAGDDEPPPPAEAAAHLAEAERSLGRGDADEAIRRARQSFFVRRTNRGWALLTRAFCRKGDLGNARASFQNVRRGPERVRVIRDCLKTDIDLR